MAPKTANNPVPREVRALFSGQRVVLCESSRAVTPLGGAAVFVAFLEKLNFTAKVREHMPFRFTSPNQIEPTFVTASRRARSRGTTRASMDGPATILCWPCSRKLTSCSTGGCAAATALPPVELWSFSKKLWRYGPSAKKSALSVPILASSTTSCSAFWKSAVCPTL